MRLHNPAEDCSFVSHAAFEWPASKRDLVRESIAPFVSDRVSA